MIGAPEPDLVDHFEKAGEDFAPLLKRIRYEADSYANGPASLLRTPQLSGFPSGSSVAPAAGSEPPEKRPEPPAAVSLFPYAKEISPKVLLVYGKELSIERHRFSELG